MLCKCSIWWVSSIFAKAEFSFLGLCGVLSKFFTTSGDTLWLHLSPYPNNYMPIEHTGTNAVHLYTSLAAIYVVGLGVSKPGRLLSFSLVTLTFNYDIDNELCRWLWCMTFTFIDELHLQYRDLELCYWHWCITFNLVTFTFMYDLELCCAVSLLARHHTNSEATVSHDPSAVTPPHRAVPLQ